MAARHLGAFKKAVHSLEGYYKSDPSVDKASRQTSCYQIFPYQTHFASLLDLATQHFEYISQPISDKLLFIKFTRHYSQEAHSLCASMGAAPQLLGFEMIAGDWCMVVMDRIGEEYVEFHESSCTPLVVNKLRDVLSRLHQAGFVHGDIRDTNIMVPRSGEPNFMLVDFDWAGKIGEVRYPMNVYRGVVGERSSGGQMGRTTESSSLLTTIFKWWSTYLTHRAYSIGFL